MRLHIGASLFFGLFISTLSFSQTVFTYRAPESKTDSRYDYDNAVLELALKMTKEKYGDYKLQPSQSMNFARAQINAKSNKNSNKQPNFFFKDSYSDAMAEKLAFVPFPVDLGIVGYRVCFASEKTASKLKEIKTLEDLRGFTMGQGAGWSDVEILKHNRFKVITSPSYESLFTMVAKDRFSLFCRGANELKGEWDTYNGKIKNFTYDKTIAVHYPLPRFFWTNKKNQKAIKRIKEGLDLAFKSGELKKLWLKHYEKSIGFVKLGERKIFKLENPNLKKLDSAYKEYQKFFYDPLKK